MSCVVVAPRLARSRSASGQRRRFLHNLSLVVSLAALAQASAPASSDPFGLERRAADALGVPTASVQSLVLPEGSLEGLPVPVLLDGEYFCLELSPHSLRAPGFRLLEAGANGVIVEVAPPPAATVRGVARKDGIAAIGRVSGSLRDGMLQATIDLSGGERRVIQPLGSLMPGADRSLHVVYDARQLPGGGGACGTIAAPGPAAGAAAGGGPVLPTSHGTSGLSVCEIAFDVDFEAFVANGSSSVAAMADIEGLLAQVSARYEASFAIAYELTTILVRTTESDPYDATEHEGFLNQMKAHWASSQGGVARDLAHLVTGKGLGGVVGFAMLNSVCSKTNGYGLTRAKFSAVADKLVSNLAHEIGHNWGATHCNGEPDCGVMCLGLGTCPGGLLGFGQKETSQILAGKKSKAGCLTVLPAPLTLPFLEDFAAKTFSKDRWPAAAGAAVSTSALGEPSGTTSANLDAGDELRTGAILLAGQSGVRLELWSQHRGVEAGETLQIDYRNAAGSWTRLHEIVSDGAQQSLFEPCVVDLPLDALHDGFQLRFVPAVDGADDDWFVDDVSLAVGGAPSPTFCTDGIDGVRAAAFVGGPGASQHDVTVARCGNEGSDLPWQAIALPGGSWVSPSPAAGVLNGANPEDVSTLTVDPSALSAGIHATRVRFENTADPSTAFEVPVTALVATGPVFAPGDRLEGVLDAADDIDVASFVGLAGESVTIVVTIPNADLAALVELVDPNGTVVATAKLKATSKPSKKTFKLKTTGLHALRVTGQSGSTGIWRIDTSAKLPKLAVSPKPKAVAPKIAGGTVDVPFLALPGTRVEAVVTPLAGSPELLLRVVDPTGDVLEPGAFGSAYGASGRRVAAMPIGAPGLHVLRVSGFTAKEKVLVTLAVTQPAAGAGTIAVP